MGGWGALGNGGLEGVTGDQRGEESRNESKVRKRWNESEVCRMLSRWRDVGLSVRFCVLCCCYKYRTSLSALLLFRSVQFLYGLLLIISSSFSVPAL